MMRISLLPFNARIALARMGLLLCALLSSPAWSHSGSTAFLDLVADRNHVHGEWLLALRDLEQAVGFDEDQDAQLTWGEIVHRLPAASAYAHANLRARSGTENCVVKLTTASLVDLDGAAYLNWPVSIECPDRAMLTELNYTALFAQDSTHRAIVKWRDARASSSRVLVFGPQQQVLDMRLGSASATNVFALIRQGVIHILEGYDHLLFLLALLVPIVFSKKMLRCDHSAVRDLLKVITAFTIGHSITLGTATVLGLNPPSRWVESAIAATVVMAGANIVWPWFRDASWRVAGLFGLIHGFGFASALRDLNLEASQLALSLLSFNIGVEIGQLLAVALVCPLLVLIARSRVMASWARAATALSTMAAGGLWLAQRIAQ